MTDRVSPIIILFMESASVQFRTSIEAFLSDSEMDPTTFGKLAMNDPSFVFDVRGGRKCSLATVDKVNAFMTGHRREDAA